MRWVVLVCAVLGASCYSTAQPRRGDRYATRTTGTCEGACSHYADCKQGVAQTTFDACVAECREIFEDQRETLRDYERLSCTDAVAFIEGDSGRPPGAAPPGAAPGGTTGATADRAD